jgi:hypothetical protein
VSTAELVPSVSVENLINQREGVIERLTEAVLLIREAARIAGTAHLGMPRFTVCTGYARGSGERQVADSYLLPSRAGDTLHQEARALEEISKIVRTAVDSGAWQYLMHESGLRSLMDADARNKWDFAIAEGDVPELTGANVRSTFAMLHASRGEMFERGVIACFKSLSWVHKTNLPQKFGKRIVITYLRSSVTPGRYGAGGTSLGHPNYDRCSRLDDLARVLHVLDGKPEPDHRHGWYARLGRCHHTTDPDAEDDYLRIKSYRNGNCHITFKRSDLVDRMNKIIATHYPGALPEPKT